MNAWAGIFLGCFDQRLDRFWILSALRPASDLLFELLKVFSLFILGPDLPRVTSWCAQRSSSKRRVQLDRLGPRGIVQRGERLLTLAS